MWKPIHRAEDLPALGSRETLNVDFKAKLDADDFEIAKDVSAFANSHGGTLILGAAGGDQLAKLLPVTPEIAKQDARRVDEAVRDRCRPPPIWSTEHVAIDGGVVTAVNVWPTAGQLIGVRLLESEVACGAPAKPHRPKEAFYFPIRIGSNTRGLTPEQLPMFMDPKVRRVATMLEPLVGQTIAAMSMRPRPNSTEFEAFRVLEVSILRNLLRLGFKDAEGNPREVSIPLDMVTSVCPAGSTHTVFIDGWVDQPAILVKEHASPELQGLLTNYRFNPRR